MSDIFRGILADKHHNHRGTLKYRAGDADGLFIPFMGVVGRTTPLRVFRVTTFSLLIVVVVVIPFLLSTR
jgi:hypothetical protein